MKIALRFLAIAGVVAALLVGGVFYLLARDRAPLGI